MTQGAASADLATLVERVRKQYISAQLTDIGELQTIARQQAAALEALAAENARLRDALAEAKTSMLAARVYMRPRLHGVQDWGFDAVTASVDKCVTKCEAALAGPPRVRNTHMNDSIVEAVQHDLEIRSLRGVAKYSKTLDRKDLGLREWLQLAYEECLDQALYLKRAIRELHASQGTGEP